MPSSPDESRLRWLGVATMPIYLAVALLAEGFRPDVEGRPPLLAILALLAGATLLYLVALRIVLRRNDATAGVRTVLLFSILYRLILLPSWPIQEIDFYRYLWDGRMTLHGSNPYRYSPTEVEEAKFREVVPADLAELQRLAERDPVSDTIFSRVHYRDIPTAYPPVSQAVFAIVVLLTPAAAPLWAQIVILKTVLLAFDIGTLLALVRLLRVLALPARWCLAYGWCPLALKEFANTGHLDAIAVFFTTLALYLLIRHASVRGATVALAVLALAVLAKSYPIVLLPLAAAYLLRRRDPRYLLPLAGFFVVLLAAYAPFRGGATRPGHHPGSGVATFLFTRWEMNDLLFTLVYRNLARTPPSGGDPWFVVVPDSWRDALNARFLDSISEWERLPDGADPAYLLALGVMVGILLLIILVQMIRIVCSSEALPLLRGCFLVLAWGWLLSSTQNPWYVLWSLPLMLFAGKRAWFLLPGLALVYYLRFWYEYWDPHNPSEGYAIFDYGIVWLEYVPLFVGLTIEALWRRPKAET